MISLASLLVGFLLGYFALLRKATWWVLIALAIFVVGVAVIDPQKYPVHLLETAAEECEAMDNRYASWSLRDCIEDLVDAWR